MAFLARQAEKEQQSLERGQSLVSELMSHASAGASSQGDARSAAEDALETFKEVKEQDLERAEARFKKLQYAEFIIGALFLLQMVFFLMRGEPYLWPLFYCAIAFGIAYVFAAVLDSKAKQTKMDLSYEVQAANKARLRNGTSGKLLDVQFKK